MQSRRAHKLKIHPAFYRRVRHYRDRISIGDDRPSVTAKFVRATENVVCELLNNPGRGHSARFESPDLADILRTPVPGFRVFAVFYRWNGETITIVTLEHTAQDLPSRLARLLG